MNSFYKFTQELKSKYPHYNLAQAAFKYDESYLKIMLNNIQIDSKKHTYQVFSTNTELREFFLTQGYCLKIYEDKYPNSITFLEILPVEVAGKELNLKEANSLLNLLPLYGLNPNRLGELFYFYLTNIRPQVLQAIKYYVFPSL